MERRWRALPVFITRRPTPLVFLHPPPFFLLIAPFTKAGPVLDFLIWTVCNVAVTVWVAIRLTVGSPGRRGQVALGTLVTFPVMMGIILGQPIGFLLLVFVPVLELDGSEEGFPSRTLGRTLLAQATVRLPLIMIMFLKRRWGFMRGVALVGFVLGVGSFALLGFSGVLSYIHLLRAVANESGGLPGISFNLMMNWQAFLINIFPTMTFSMRMILAGVLISSVSSSSTYLARLMGR